MMMMMMMLMLMLTMMMVVMTMMMMMMMMMKGAGVDGLVVHRSTCRAVLSCRGTDAGLRATTRRLLRAEESPAR
eukprot:3924336-Karenia_brevis.AAC.1